MDNDTARDLLAAWALDAVDDVERAGIERAIRDDAELAAEARALRETVGLLAASGAVAPPPALRAEVLARSARTSQVGGAGSAAVQGSGAPGDVGVVDDTPDGTTPVSSGRRASRRSVPRWLSVAAAVAVAAAVPGGIALQQADRAQRAEQQVEAISDALGQPGAQLLSAGVEGGGRAVAVVTDGGAVFAASDLPELDDRDYQLWVIEGDTPLPRDVLRLEDGATTMQVADVPVGSLLALTVEPVGGSQTPSGPPIVALATT